MLPALGCASSSTIPPAAPPSAANPRETAPSEPFAPTPTPEQTPPLATAPADVPVVHREPSERHRAVVAAPDRTDDDRQLDAGRKPAQLLAFLELEPGMQVAELQAGFGYTTELIARSVGPDGKVFAQNNAFVRERFLEPHWTQRLATPPMANVVRLDTELDHPFPPQVHDLDMVLIVLFYHDTYWQQTDREAMNAAVFAALKPGGSYVVIDHSARRGDGDSGVQTLHRVEESLVRGEIEGAGFSLREQAGFLRNPEDPRDWNASPRAAQESGLRGMSDRFVYRFVKPG